MYSSTIVCIGTMYMCIVKECTHPLLLMIVQSTIVCIGTYVHDVIGDVERPKERKKKERHLMHWQNENESCLRWDSNPRHSVFQTDALPTELPRQPSWQGPNQTSHTPI